ncbi:MAG: ferritin-like domain-containing protein [Clostridia bacterium]|nr:ferritin-like domain-containing protein [Clostridia bacterium]
MNSYPQPNQARPPRFRPPLEGCVAKDRYLSRALESCYIDSFASIAANIYRSLTNAGRDRTAADAFDAIATEELENFRTLGELILALGGELSFGIGTRGRGRSGMRYETDPVRAALQSAQAERQRNIDRYETLMSRTGDRVVRSVLAGLLSSERRMYERLNALSE